MKLWRKIGSDPGAVGNINDCLRTIKSWKYYILDYERDINKMETITDSIIWNEIEDYIQNVKN